MDFAVSNYMMNHEEWFLSMREPEQPSYVETRDSSRYPIQHIGDVPFNQSDKEVYINTSCTSWQSQKMLPSLDKSLSKECKFGSTRLFVECLLEMVMGHANS